MSHSYTFREKVSIFDKRYGLGRIEFLLSTNWLNLLLTIYLNFRSFPFLQAIRLPIFVYGSPRIYNLVGSMKMTCKKITPGMIKFNYVMPGAPNCTSGKSEINNEGTILFNGRGEIGTGTKIRVALGATLKIGNRFKITDMCNVGCLNSIVLGDDTWIVHRSQIFDSNYHFIEDLNTRKIPKMTKYVVIGKRCWICNSVSVCAGAVIPDNTIVASSSLVSKDYSNIPPYSLLGGVPAKVIKVGVRWLKKGTLQNEVTNFYKYNSEVCFVNNHPVERDIEEQ